MSIKMYGIPNCDTVKKVKNFLGKKIDYQFFDFKKEAPTKKLLKEWKKQLGALPINARGPTYRKIKESFEEASLEQKMDLLIKNSSAIKRPVVTVSEKVYSIGFDVEKLQKLLEEN